MLFFNQVIFQEKVIIINFNHIRVNIWKKNHNMYMVIERGIVEVNVNLLFVLHYIIAMHVADTKCKMSISFYKLFKYISEIDLFTTPKEMIEHYYSQIKQNGILNDSIDVVRSQTCKKAFDYQFMTVEGKKNVLSSIL